MTAPIERTGSTRARRLLGLALSGAAMATVAPAAHATVYVFSSGNYNPGVTSPNPLGAGDVLQIIAGSTKFFTSVAFVNNGQVDWSDSFYLQSGGSIANNGLFNALGDNTIIYNGGSTTVFNNTGTFRKSGGLGATTIGGIAFVNSGVIDAQTGTISFAGGDATFNAGTSFIGAGINAINNNAVFNGAFSSSNLDFNNGFFTGNGAQLTGTADFTGGNFTGDWTIANGASGCAERYRNFRNASGLRWCSATIRNEPISKLRKSSASASTLSRACCRGPAGRSSQPSPPSGPI